VSASCGLMARKYSITALLISLISVSISKGDIVDGIHTLGDSISLWSAKPPAWKLSSSVSAWDELVRDTLDVKGDSVLIKYPALHEDRFVSNYVELNKGQEKSYSIQSAWHDSIWVVGGQVVGSVNDGWSNPELQDYFRARQLQLQLLLHANLEKVNIPFLDDTVPVKLVLVGRDMQKFALSHDAALRIIRHIGMGALSHAFYLGCKKEDDQILIEWGVFIRQSNSSFQHLLIVEDRIVSPQAGLMVESVAMRLLPGIRTDNVVDALVEETKHNPMNRKRWTVEIREDSK